MAILDELLRKLKSVTLDKTNLDERAVNFVKPRIQNTQQAVARPLARIQTGIGGVNNPGDSGSALERIKNAFSIDQNNSIPNRFWRGGISTPLVKTQENIQRGNLLTQFKQPDDIVKKNPWMAFTNSSLDIGNTLLKMPTQVGYDLANKRMWQGKENPISDPVNLGTLLPSLKDLGSMNPEQRKQILSDIFKRSVESAKPIAVASGLNAPKIVAGMTGLGGLFGYGGAKLEGKKGKEALDATILSAGDQFGRAVPMAGLMRFTNPIGEKLGQLTASKVSALGAPKLAQWLTKKATEGAFNSAEGVALNPLIDRPLFEDVLVDFFLPGTLDVTGKALRGVSDVPVKLLKNAIRDFDLTGFDTAIATLKSQGIKVADDAVAEFKKVMASQGGFVAPGEFTGVKQGRSQQELFDLVKSGEGTVDMASGMVKVRDGAGNLVNAGRMVRDLIVDALYAQNKTKIPDAPLDLSGKTADDFLRSPESGAVGTVVKGMNGEYGSDQITARERFNIPSLKKLSGGGSDRDVYDLGADVLKVTKTARGLDQNRMADYYASEAGLIPEIKEIGRNYVVFEKVGKPDANTKAMIKELNDLGMIVSIGGYTNYDNLQKAYDIMEKYGYPSGDLANYGANILWGDMRAIRNWGTKDGKPILVDEGSLDGNFVNTHSKKKAQGITNLDDPEFSQIYYKSKQLKRGFGDTDKNTMYGFLPPLAPTQDEEGNVGVRFAPEVTLGGMAIAGGLREVQKGDLESTMKSFNKLADFKKFGENAKDMIVKEAKALADSVQGVELIPTGQDGRSIRASMNPDWYRRFFASNNRAPNNQELFNLAEENLRTGRLTGEITDPGELKAMNEFLDADKAGVSATKNPLLLNGRENVPLLEAPEQVITSKKKLLDIFKKTGEAKPFLNELKPRTKPIIAGAQQIPTASTGDEARAIIQQYGKMPEMAPQRVTLDEVINQPGRTVEDRGRKIEEVLYGSATPRQEDLGGTKEGAGVFSNLLRSGVGKVSETVGDALSNPNPIVRNTASLLQDLAGNLGKSGEQIIRKSQFSGGIDYATKLGGDTQKYISSLVGNSTESLSKIHSVLDPELSTTKVDYESLTPKEKEATDFLRYVSDFINETNFKNEFISKEKYLENTDGKYIARAYEPYDFPPELADFMEQRNQKLDLDPFKQRTEVTDWKQENAIRDPAYLVAKRLQQTLFNDNFKSMANWLNTTDMVSDTMKPGYVKVADHKAYGEMSGKFIRKDALEDIKGFFFSNQTAQKAYDMLNWWDKLAPRRFRKKMLTVFNPAVRLGNNVGNYVFSWFNGINPVTFASNRSWADKAMKGNDPLYRRAIKDGLLGSDLTRGDIQRFANELKTGTKDDGVLRKIDKVLSDSYGRVDDLAKLSALKTHLDRGFTYDEAFKRVYNGFQNYNAVGFLYDVGAKIPILGNPFVRFKADILRMMKNAVVDHPVRTAGTILAWNLFTDVMSGISGETQVDRETREQRLGAPRIPFTNVSLAVQTPWGEVNASRLVGLYAMNQLGESGGTSDVADYLPFEAPALKNVGTDPLVGGALSVAVDTDFRGKKISDPDYSKYTGSLLTDEEKNANRVKYLMRAYNLPTLNDVSDIGSAVKGEPNFYGSKRTPIQSILRTGGLKVEQFGAEEAQLARDKNDMYSMNAVEAEQRKISQIKNQLSRGEIREDEATKRIDAIQNNINKLQSDVTGKDDVAGSTGEAGDIPEARVKSLNNIFGMNRVTSMPEGTNYEKAQKKAEQFAIIDKALDSDFLSADEQESYLSQVTDFKKEEIGYYRVAKGGTDERYGFILDKIEAQDSDLMSTLATMRYEIDEKKILTNNLVDRLEDEGYLTNSQAKMLKKLEYNQSTGEIGVSGSGSTGTKVAKAIAKLNSDNSKDLRELFQQLSKTSSTSRRSAKDMIDFSRKANSITAPNSRSISDVLSSKRTIKPIAKLG